MYMYPRIGATISTVDAIQLCNNYGLYRVSRKIMEDPSKYRSWCFDGVSGLPDVLNSWIGDGFNITYKCALPHDLAYGYGAAGDSASRRSVDRTFRENLIKEGGVGTIKAYICWSAVRFLGSERLGLSFSWGFADRYRYSLSDNPLSIAL